MKFRLKAILIIFLTAIFCLYPPLRNYKQNDIKAGFDYFAADAFYYLNVADKYQKTGFSSFDGQKPTNGFHPLWQNILNFTFSKIIEPENRIKFVFFLSVALVTIGFIFLATGFLKFFDSFPLSFPGIIPGFLFLLFSFILFPYGSPWSFINGMETPLSVFLFGLLFLILSFNKDESQVSGMKLIAISFLIALIGLARLDDFLLLIAFSLFLVIQSEKKLRLKKSLIFLILPIIILTVYIIYNQHYSGFLLPVSGLIKSNFSLDNFIYTFSTLFSIGIKDNFYGENAYWRIILLYYPLIISVISLIKYRKNRSHDFNILVPLSVYVILKTGYNLFFVSFWDQGHWYFALNIIISNILIIDIIQKYIPKKTKPVFAIAGTIIIALIFSNFYMEKFRFKENKYYEFWQKRAEIEKQIQETYKGKGIIEFDDGIISWSLKYPALSGTGLSLDKEAYNYYQKGEFLDLAYQRGFRAISSLVYINQPANCIYSQAELNRWLKYSFPALKNQKLEKWNFSLKIYDKNTNFYLIEILEK